MLSASHNPGGPDEDFGIKYNVANGGPAPEKVTDAIHARTLTIDRWLTVEGEDIDLDALGTVSVGDMTVEIVDPVTDYAALMETLFDFDAIRAANLTMAFDAMSAITGPMRPRSWRSDWASRPARCATVRRCPISAVIIPTPIWSMRAPSTTR